MNSDDLAIELIADAAREESARHRLPESTYRLQFHAGFTFRDAIAILPYLRDLGITHAYASPFLKAAPGSTHGYDVVDFAAINPEIGSAADFDAWTSALAEHGMGQILDFVPNHMGVGTNENAWWNDVLEHGPASRFASYFDIAWRAFSPGGLEDRVLLPVLGEPFGDVIEAGSLRLAYDSGDFSIHYGDRRFPLDPASFGQVLGFGIDDFARAQGESDPAVIELRSILTAITNLPVRSAPSREQLTERERETRVMKTRLETLMNTSDAARGHLEHALVAFNGQPGDPESFNLLDRLLEEQCYRLAYWRVASDEINYRRFFDVNSLAALAMERPEVFEAAHALVVGWLAQGRAGGLRIDHPDGLYDPRQYFERLQERYRLACTRCVFDQKFATALDGPAWSDIEPLVKNRLAAGPGNAWESAGGPPLYALAEKILGTGESLQESWPVAGTTGYEFLNQASGLFVDRDGRAALDHSYRNLVEDDSTFAEVVYRSKKLIVEVSLASELHMLTSQLAKLAERSRRSRDFTFNTLRRALEELIACFPVYRSYIDDRGASDFDRRYIALGIRRASARNPLLSRRLFRFVLDLLVADEPGGFDLQERRSFAGKFQQVTSPVAAKGVEDTAFYVFNRLASLNEVGGDPAAFGTTPTDFHAFCQARGARWPFGLSPLSTHDTKRSEDVRARINVLSEIPQQWFERVNHWRSCNAHHRATVDDLIAPDANEEYLLYQTLLGAWPLESDAQKSGVPADFVERIQNYMVKAGHEAKRHSSWLNPDLAYDQAIRSFVAVILDERASQPFLDDFRAFERRVSHFGLLNSLCQTLVKLVAPGVADTFQGTEIWDFSLVDPDNRRPVDIERRQRMLGAVKQAIAAQPGDRSQLCRELVASKDDGRVKLFLHHVVLHVRRSRPGLFATGDYQPLEVEGANSAYVVGFSRSLGDQKAVVAFPRLWTRLLPTAASTDADAAAAALPENRALPDSHADHRPGALRSPESSPADAQGVLWHDTRLVLAADAAGSRWHNVFSGETNVAEGGEERPFLPCARLFAHFPVALLLNDSP